jgi:hypothetical protein
VILTAAVSSALTALALVMQGWTPSQQVPGAIKLDNACVRVSEIDYAPNLARPRYTRPTDQVIVFMDECRIKRSTRRAGLKKQTMTNIGYRSEIIEVKEWQTSKLLLHDVVSYKG